MARTNKQTTSLWSVIESMQQRLEAEGLDSDVVDAAVTRGLEALLDIAPPVRKQARSIEARPARRPALWRPHAPAKA